MPYTKPVFVRNLDPELWKAVHVAAIKAGVNIGEWLTAAIKARLKAEGG